MSWELLLDNDAKKQLHRVPKRDSERILAIIKELPANPYAGDIEKMKGEKNIWRRRVGSYRIFYEIIDKRSIIYVFNIVRRASSTY